MADDSCANTSAVDIEQSQLQLVLWDLLAGFSESQHTAVHIWRKQFKKEKHERNTCNRQKSKIYFNARTTSCQFIHCSSANQSQEILH